jgi:hypothetical protein
VRFVRVIRVPACARVSRVSRVCPGSPRCLFTGIYIDSSRHIRFAPPVEFVLKSEVALRVQTRKVASLVRPR